MKAMMIAGALAGFVIGAGSSLWNGGNTQMAFWHAGLAALAGGWLGRWCGHVWFVSIAEVVAKQQRERQEANNAALEAQMKKRS